MGDPIRILHVVVNMNRGGAETLIMNLYRNVDRSQVQFDFLTCKAGEFDEEINQLGGNVHRIPYVREVGHFAYLRALRQFFMTHPQYQIVHSHMDKMSGFVLRAARKTGVSVRIAHSHSTRNEGGFAASLYKWYAGLNLLPHASHLLACSNNAAKWLFSRKMVQAHIVKNGIDVDKFAFSPEVRRQVREELQVNPDDLVIGHVGRFSHPKNHSFLLEVFAELLKENPRAILILAGDGPLRNEIAKKADKLNLTDHIKLLGVRSDIHRLLQAFDVCVFPSIYEGSPVTLVEAQGAGLPCLISDTITREVDMGAGLIQFESLNNSPCAWAAKVMKRMERTETKSFIRKQGFDIRDTASWLQNYYLNKKRNGL